MRTEYTRKLVMGIAITLAISGCATDAGQKEQGGAVIGAIIGGILGGAAAGNRNRPLGAAVGALAGGLLGGQMGRYFDEQDRRRIAEASIRALQEGASQTYVSPKTGATVTMTPSPSTYEPGRSIRALPAVYTSSELRSESRQAFAATDLPARASPAATSDVTGRFVRGEQLEVVGIVPASLFRLVAKDGIAVGYVIESDLVPSLAALPPLPQSPECKIISVNVTRPDGRVEKSVQKACTGPDGRYSPMQIAESSTPTTKSPPKSPARPAKKPIAKTPANKTQETTPPAEVVVAKSATTTQETNPAQQASPPAASAVMVAAELKSIVTAKECKVLTLNFKLPNGQLEKRAQNYCSEPPASWQTA